MLHLITGQNGAGKSLRAIELMYKRHGEGMEVYAFGFRGLKAPFVKPFADPRRWRELPANAVLFVDEAQQVWRTRSGGRPVPPEVMDLETHRHQGIDIYLITQSPMYLDSHLRPLISSHEHLISYDKSSARLFRFTECYEDVKSSALRSKAQFEVWKYPVVHYADYDSAEVHTAKAKVPWRQRIAKVFFALAGLLIVGGIAYFFWGPETPKAKPAAGTAAAPAKSLGSSLLGGFGNLQSGRGERHYANAQEYVEAQPRLYCMSSGEGIDRTCTCLTEQGTKWQMRIDQCVQMARWGPAYNPYKEAPQLAAGSLQEAREARREAQGRNDARGVSGVAIGAEGTFERTQAYPSNW